MTCHLSTLHHDSLQITIIIIRNVAFRKGCLYFLVAALRLWHALTSKHVHLWKQNKVANHQYYSVDFLILHHLKR